MHEYVKRADQLRTGGRVIGARWVVTNKADAAAPDIPARLAGKEYRIGCGDSLYASTSPSRGTQVPDLQRGDARRQGLHAEGVMISDVRGGGGGGAYVDARAARDLYTEIPDEDPMKRPGLLGKLRLCLYGTRDAAVNWQDTLARHLETIGVRRGKGHPAVFVHEERRLQTLGHGDGYVSVRDAKDLLWLRASWNKPTKSTQ